ncbi:hypothetical protein [Micromonospora sp. NPDC001898]|uniref:hypothetical protein n=1 Tax=Micromonospora sp. NPDC001898 TaxID=3364221 RepID=UPI0036C63099
MALPAAAFRGHQRPPGGDETVSDPARTLYEALRALEHRARVARRAAGSPFSRRETAREVQRSRGVDLRGQRISSWLPDDPNAAQVPRDSDEVWALVRLWCEWAGDPAPDRRFWSDLVEAAQPRRAQDTMPSAVPGRPVGEFTDPHALEVHPAIGLAAGLPSLPAYVGRDHDAQLARLVDRAVGGQSTITLLVGGSSTGKTRACWEAVQRLPDGWRLWHPIEPSPPESILREIGAVAPRTVLWLNEIQLYLLTQPAELGERVATGLRELLRDADRAPVLVLGTIWPEYLNQLTGESSRSPQARKLLAATSIKVRETFTESQMDVVRSASDPRLVHAAKYAEEAQITQYLAGVPMLTERYRNAPAAARAVIHSAMDARFLGHGPNLSIELLAAAAPGYLTDRQWETLQDDWLEHALTYTAEPCRGVRGPLAPIRIRPGQRAPTERHYRLADYLERLGSIERRARSVPATLWNALLLQHDKTDFLRLGDHAALHGLYRLAFRFLVIAVEAREPYALSCIAQLFIKMGRAQEAIVWFQARVEDGDTKALHWLAHALRNAGCTDEAMAVFRRSADLGNTIDMRWLASMLREAGRTGEATAVHQRAVESDGTGQRTVSDLADVVSLMTASGRVEELIAWLKERAEAGNGPARAEGVRLLEQAERYDEAVSLSQLAGEAACDLKTAELLLRAGRTNEAIDAYRRIADSTDADPWLTYPAEFKAVRLLRDVGRIGEAIDWLKGRAATGHGDHRQLVELLKEHAQTAEAMTWLESAARAGDLSAIGRLVDLLEETGHTDEAIGWLKVGAEADGHLRWRLAKVLEDNDRLDEAITFLLGLARDETLVTTLLRKAGRLEEAIALLPVDGIGDARVPGHVSERSYRVELLREAGRIEEAIAWLKELDEAGDWEAADQVADLLAEEDRLDEAVSLLKRRAAGGDARAAGKAAAMLRDAGRTSEIVTWVADGTDVGRHVLRQAARWLQESGRTEEAIALYQRAAGVAGGVGTAWIQAASQVIELLKGRGRVDEAIGWLKAQADAGEVKALDELAHLLYDSGRIEESLTFFGRAIEAGAYGFWGRLPPYVANGLCGAGYGEWVDRMQRYGIEPGGRPALPWAINEHDVCESSPRSVGRWSNFYSE